VRPPDSSGGSPKGKSAELKAVPENWRPISCLFPPNKWFEVVMPEEKIQNMSIVLSLRLWDFELQATFWARGN